MSLDTLWNALFVLLFVLIGGVFAATEMAIVSLREGQIRAFEEGNQSAQRIAKLVRNPNRFLSAVQVGVTLAGFFSSAYGASTIAPDIAPVFASWGMAPSVAEPLAFVACTLVIAYLSLVLGELVPKRLAMQRPVSFTRVLAPPLGLLSTLMRPVIWLLSISTNLFVRLFGGDPAARSGEVTSDEIRAMIVAAPDLEDDSRDILGDVFGARERLLVEVMTPRTDVHFLEATMNAGDAHLETLRLPYTRYPVIGDDLDDVLGYIHIRDLASLAHDIDTAHTADHADPAGHGPTVGDALREIVALPETNQVFETLEFMRTRNKQMALIVDEYGGTSGIVTIEDLVEEVVGEIYDEFNHLPDPEDRTLDVGEAWEIDGSLILQEFEKVASIALPEGPYETVGGFVNAQLGRLARTGDEVVTESLRIRVIQTTGRRIVRLEVTRLE